MKTTPLLTSLKAETERQTQYANTDGWADSNTSCDAAYWLQKAVDRIENLEHNLRVERLERDRFWQETIELTSCINQLKRKLEKAQ